MTRPRNETLSDEIVAMVTENSGRAKVSIVGRSMHPLLRAGMVAEIEKLRGPAAPSDILVFRTWGGLIAHRLIAVRGDGYVTCGDAYPERLEHIAQSSVLGRVAAVWSDAGARAHRVDGPAFRLLGRSMCLTRPVRATLRHVKQGLRFLAARPSPSPAFGTLVSASSFFERGDYDSALARLKRVSPEALREALERHGMTGFLLRWLEDAQRCGADVPPELLDYCRRTRWSTALCSDANVEIALDVIDHLANAGIDAIVLKGSARLLNGEADANAHYSCDVDMLVPKRSVSAAVEALRGAGYGFRDTRDKIKVNDKYLHHQAPLWRSGARTPLELHVALCIPRSVTARLDYDELLPHSKIVEAVGRRVRILDEVGTAVHLAYHARDFQKFRDIVLLGRSLRRMSAEQRRQFDALVSVERRDRVRLRSAVAAADALSFSDRQMRRDVAAYISWAIAREELPQMLARRTSLIETLRGRSGLYFRGVGFFFGQLVRTGYDLIALPTVLRWEKAVRRESGDGAELLTTATRS